MTPRNYTETYHEEYRSQRTPLYAEVKHNWNSLCGEETQVSGRYEWIGRKEIRKIGNMDLGPIEIMKITSFFLKLTIGNFPEIIKYKIKYKITGLMHSPLPTGILKKNNAIMEES